MNQRGRLRWLLLYVGFFLNMGKGMEFLEEEEIEDEDRDDVMGEQLAERNFIFHPDGRAPSLQQVLRALAREDLQLQRQSKRTFEEIFSSPQASKEVNAPRAITQPVAKKTHEDKNENKTSDMEKTNQKKKVRKRALAPLTPMDAWMKVTKDEKHDEANDPLDAFLVPFGQTLEEVQPRIIPVGASGLIVPFWKAQASFPTQFHLVHARESQEKICCLYKHGQPISLKDIAMPYRLHPLYSYEHIPGLLSEVHKWKFTTKKTLSPLCRPRLVQNERRTLTRTRVLRSEMPFATVQEDPNPHVNQLNPEGLPRFQTWHVTYSLNYMDPSALNYMDATIRHQKTSWKTGMMDLSFLALRLPREAFQLCEYQLETISILRCFKKQGYFNLKCPLASSVKLLESNDQLFPTG